MWVRFFFVWLRVYFPETRNFTIEENPYIVFYKPLNQFSLLQVPYSDGVIKMTGHQVAVTVQWLAKTGGHSGAAQA